MFYVFILQCFYIFPEHLYQSINLINLLKAKGPNGHLRRSKIHDMQ